MASGELFLRQSPVKSLILKPCMYMFNQGVYVLWLSGSIFLLGRQAVLPPSQPPHPCHQVSTCPSLLFYSLPSSSSSSSSSPWYANIPGFPGAWMHIHGGFTFGPLHPFCNDWTNSSTARNDSPQTSFLSNLASQPGLSCCRLMCSWFSSGWGCQVFMTGGLYEVALNGLRRVT